MPISQQPPPGTQIPAAISDVASGPTTLVWVNEAGGVTARVGPSTFVKWNPAGSGESLADEAQRMAWLARYHPVPAVVDLITRDDGELLITKAVTDASGVVALSAVDPQWVARPDEAIRAIAIGLRRLHSLPVESCPFTWSVESRIAEAAALGVVIPDELRSPPAIDQLVVCHGDPCAPNTLLHADGTFAANVDLARVGLADRWADLAVATMSLGWNYPDYDESVFWEAYGVGPDFGRISYYRKLWNAG